MEERPGFQESPANGWPNTSFSTPFTSAACSPGRSADQAVSSFFSASTPASPPKMILGIDSLAGTHSRESSSQFTASEEFDFSARFSEADQLWVSTPMSCADELFCNGQIRPLWYTGEDLYSSNSTQYVHDDDREDGYYFRSSADYKFSMLSLQQSYASAMDIYGLSSRYHDQQLCVDKLMDESNAEEVNLAQTTVENLIRQTSRRQDVGMAAKPASRMKEEGNRGRLIGNGSVRRTRSLSPQRVFHMDDDLPKQLIEGHFVKSFEGGNLCNVAEYKQQKGDGITRRKARVTLKDLFHNGDKGDHGFTGKRPASSISKKHRKHRLEPKVDNCNPKSSPKQRLESSRKSPHLTGGVQGPGSPRGLPYSSPNVRSEGMRQQTFLPYRNGLLACLGFSSKNHWSVAGMRSVHSKSQRSESKRWSVKMLPF